MEISHFGENTELSTVGRASLLEVPPYRNVAFMLRGFCVFFTHL